jgi:hypothetical protein
MATADAEEHCLHLAARPVGLETGIDRKSQELGLPQSPRELLLGKGAANVSKRA